MEKKATICDVCEKRIAQNKCAVCGDDICIPCSNAFRMTVMASNKAVLVFDQLTDETTNGDSILVCKDCIRKLTLAMANKDNAKQVFATLKEAIVEDKI